MFHQTDVLVLVRRPHIFSGGQSNFCGYNDIREKKSSKGRHTTTMTYERERKRERETEKKKRNENKPSCDVLLMTGFAAS